MTGEHAEVALQTWDVNLVNFAGEGELFRRDEIEVEGGHGIPEKLRMPGIRFEGATLTLSN
jgi:hypothetical protein